MLPDEPSLRHSVLNRAFSRARINTARFPDQRLQWAKKVKFHVVPRQRRRFRAVASLPDRQELRLWAAYSAAARQSRRLPPARFRKLRRNIAIVRTGLSVAVFAIISIRP